VSVVMSRCQSRCRSRYRSILSFLVLNPPPLTIIQDDVKLAQLVRAQDCQSQGRQFDSGKSSKNENSILHGFEVHRPSIKGTKLLFQVIKAIMHESNLRESI